MLFLFFNYTATTEIYTLSLHDALPICVDIDWPVNIPGDAAVALGRKRRPKAERDPRSEEHTSELQSRQYLVCRLLLEKKKVIYMIYMTAILCYISLYYRELARTHSSYY